jgi:hypothetical protein
MGPAEVVEALPLLEVIVEELGVVDHDPFEHPVELLLLDPVCDRSTFRFSREGAGLM